MAVEAASGTGEESFQTSLYHLRGFQFRSFVIGAFPLAGNMASWFLREKK